jgi:hypothetical protein
MSTTAIQFFISLRNAVKIYHWNTKYYARHIASDSFVSKIDELIDRFVEVYIGRYERDQKLTKRKNMEMSFPVLNETSVVNFLQHSAKWLENELPKSLNKRDTELFNIRDEMLAEINQTLYLFTIQ